MISIISNEYDKWVEKAIADEDLIAELEKMDDVAIEDAFYRELSWQILH